MTMASSFYLSSLLFITTLTITLLSSSAQIQNISSFSISDSPWRPTQTRLLLSPSSIFAAGFRPVPASQNLYTFSIWYYNVSVNDTVWSANDNSPVDRFASLIITPSGQLFLNSSSGENLWPSPATATGPPNSTQLSLSDFGNLIYGGWESFNHPTNTILPNQNINGTTLSSRTGDYIFNNSRLFFTGSPSYYSSDNGFLRLDDSGRISQENGQSMISSDLGLGPLRRLTLDDDGNLKIYSYNRNSTGSNRWTAVWKAIFEPCRIYGTCGPNSICMNDYINSNPTCTCPPGFRRAPGNATFSCELKTRIVNPINTKFLRLDYVNFTGGSNQTNIFARNFTTCEAQCLSKPNCLGFGFKYDGNQYCVHQMDRLLYGYWSPGTEAAFFIRVDNSEPDTSNFTGMTNILETACPVRISLPSPPEESNTTTRNIIIISTLFAAELISGVLFFWAFLRKYVKYRDMARTFGLEFLPAGGPKRFSYAELKLATNDFSNMIGRGGFGDVYKGELTDHRVVAVKCLKNVTGGDAEFWAEVTIIARMHHLNLVRLWGFCAEKGQRILVYEYVSNGSLDKFLFHSDRDGSDDQETGLGMGRKPLLDWNIRYRIALGVARAIAYLHEECLEWVLHCDIKPENILLGEDFCPKISDFGLAKLKKKEDMVSMSRIRGTRGYMAPEWIKMDPITPKADVYSFGMVLLEIVNGMRNFEIQGSKMESEDWYFPRWAFDKVFKENNVEDILDGRIKHCYDSEVHHDMLDRMVKTAMWCLQDRPETRPSMGKVAKMLEGTVEIIEPTKPTIFFLGNE